MDRKKKLIVKKTDTETYAKADPAELGMDNGEITFFNCFYLFMFLKFC